MEKKAFCKQVDGLSEIASYPNLSQWVQVHVASEPYVQYVL